jgi:hypothetical protein
VSKREIAVVLETCCTELRKEWMDTEGLFRIAGGQGKVKFLKVRITYRSLQWQVSTNPPELIQQKERATLLIQQNERDTSKMSGTPC